MKGKAIALAAGCCLLLSGCGGLDLLPYARELEGMALMRTLGVDAAAEGVAVTASTDAGEDGGERAEPVREPRMAALYNCGLRRYCGK